MARPADGDGYRPAMATDERDLSEPLDPSEQPHDVSAGLIRAGCETLTAIAGTYLDVLADDVSPRERARLTRAAGLVGQAVDLLS